MSITPEQIQQAIQAAVAAAAHQWPEAAAQMQQEIGTLRTQVQAPPTTSASLVDTRLLGKPESFDGSAKMERLECRLSKLCVCLLCTLWDHS